MPTSLPFLADEIRSLLTNKPVSECADEISSVLKKALTDDDFISEHLPNREAGASPREILYEDLDLGFCICGHVYAGEAIGQPHDHGPSWAIYGQARGSTEMTEWRIVKPGKGDESSLVEPVDTYVMKPGDAHFYDVGDVHSPKRTAPTRLIRIEGANLDNVTRSKITAAASAS
jgi:predicted metal-dependent enzyme (double-stranded beta helix superfamily)